MVAKNKRLTLNILTLFITVLFCFLLAEWIIRFFPFLYCEGYRPAKNDKIVYELLPNFQVKSLNAKINAQGLNDRYFSLDKAENTFRIAVVGDSTSFGWKVERKDSFPKILERMLNQRLKGRRFEVINFSVPGYNTSQEYELIKEKVIKFNPDMVLLVFCSNDVHICNYFKPKLTVLNYSYNKSYLVHYLLRGADVLVRHQAAPMLTKSWTSFKKNVLGMFYEEQRIYLFPGLEDTEYITFNPPDSKENKENVPSSYWYMIGYDNYKTHLSNILGFLKQRNILFVSSGFLHPEEALAINQELGIGSICNFYTFASSEAYAKEYLADGHLNKKGHYLVARFLYEFLNKKGLLL